MKPDLRSGIAAISLKGRDKGRAFVVLCELDADFVLVSDGRLRGLARPKKKRRKHLRPIGQELPGFSQAQAQKSLTDHQISAFLKALKDPSPTDPA